MKRSETLDDFRRDPVGRYALGRTFLCWCYAPARWGCTYWGRFAERDTRDLVLALDAELHPDVPAHSGLADLRLIEGTDPDAFAVLGRYLESRGPHLQHRISRQAVLRPAGMTGSLVAGFYDVHVPSYPVRIFSEERAAWDWLGWSEDAAMFATVQRLHESIVVVPEVVRELRRALASGKELDGLPAAAAHLRVSTRTLQRQLQRAGTTFQAERHAARVEAAKARLLTTDEKLTTIALDVGFSSLQHFSALFRKATGDSPGAWRARMVRQANPRQAKPGVVEAHS